MRHVIGIALLSMTVSWLSLAPALAQAAEKTKRVGFVVMGSHGPRSHLELAFLAGLREQGYVEGRNLVVERVYGEGNAERLREGAGALAALPLDVIVSTCSPSTRAVKQATSATGTPIVMAVVSDPVRQGLIVSLAQPGGSVTGRASLAEATVSKMLELFSAVLPQKAEVAVLYNTGNPIHPLLWEQLLQAGQALDRKLLRVDVAGPKDFPAALDTVARERLGGMLVLPDDNMTMNFRAQLVELAAKQRVPTFYGVREFVDQGGLMSYGENVASSYRSTAVHVAKVLAGAKPADLPVEQPTRFEFVVNAAAAKALGLALPDSVLIRADDVIR